VAVVDFPAAVAAVAVAVAGKKTKDQMFRFF
jgi:hypothetical protein